MLCCWPTMLFSFHSSKARATSPLPANWKQKTIISQIATKFFMLHSHFSWQYFVSYITECATVVCYIFAGICFLIFTYQCCRRNWTRSEKPSGITIELESKEKQICHLEFQIIYIASQRSMDWKIVVCQSRLFFLQNVNWNLSNAMAFDKKCFVAKLVIQ